MGLENINAGALRGAIADCKSKLSTSKEAQVISSISNDSIWKATSRATLVDGINQLIKKINELKADLDSCGAIADCIDQYNQLKSEKNSLQRDIDKIKQNSSDSDDEKTMQANIAKISKKQSQIKSKQQKMTDLEKKVSSLV